MKDYNGFTGLQRRRAQAWLNEQWRRGTLARPSECVACGLTEGVLDAHAEDYSDPFAAGKTDQYHLCYRCHMMVHCRFRSHTRWEWYKAQLMAGVRFTPFHTRNFPLFASQTLNGNPPVLLIGEPRRDVLSKIG